METSHGPGSEGMRMAARSNVKPLDFELVRLVSGRCWSLSHQMFMSRRAEVLLYAEQVLGNRRLSERWFIEKAIGLGRCSPCSLLEEPRGYELVMEHLYRIEHGVYC
ncbi:antitoxin Xre/MbcA/ParS toxin-binding domain-containing protein [Pseudomonas sp. Je.1.5.c]|uniref:antitoxin Xre/MbcA/ParS toxin-binding domain-containing protein n=1 Tax=Pseudomonas sp. Je.1.5.c TaxID=3142839 RepID=UPI003DAA34CA